MEEGYGREVTVGFLPVPLVLPLRDKGCPGLYGKPQNSTFLHRRLNSTSRITLGTAWLSCCCRTTKTFPHCPPRGTELATRLCAGVRAKTPLCADADQTREGEGLDSTELEPEKLGHRLSGGHKEPCKTAGTTSPFIHLYPRVL